MVIFLGNKFVEFLFLIKKLILQQFGQNHTRKQIDIFSLFLVFL